MVSTATVAITDGSFDGPRLSGRVLPGGGDWTLLRADGVLELDLRITGVAKRNVRSTTTVWIRSSTAVRRRRGWPDWWSW